MIDSIRSTPGPKNRTRPTLTLSIALLFVAALSAGQAKQKFTGVITDDMCAKGDHSAMRMGPNDAECTKACIALHSASYVLYDGKSAYVLSDQKLPEKLAGQKVTVVGTLDANTKTIKVDSIAAAAK
ncbi:MAG TPA: hypothetical protein VKB50_31955 [Vicinamibacterales bacterium]|nr:hypothetical protein [Vicinamibacterales bacterium]